MSMKDHLFEIADRQQGYFTTGQAVECGYSQPNFRHHVASKEWIKVQRGIYRLARYPVTSHPELVVWSLWSRDINGDVQGVWSYETALEIYEISDVMPAKMHMTVPKKFRRRSKIPKNLILHFEDLHKTMVKGQQGYLVTSPLKTILDIVEEGKLSEEFIIQAIQEALQKGLISHKELQKIAESKAKLMRILNDYKI